MAKILDRIKSIQASLKNHQAYFITDEFNIRYLSNFSGTNGQIFLTKNQCYLLTDFRYLRVAKKVLPPSIKLINISTSLSDKLNQLIAKTKTDQLFFEEKNLSHLRFRIFKKNLNIKKISPGLNFVENFRMVKNSLELKLIVKAQRIAEKVFIEVRKNLKPGKTENQIAWEIEMLGHKYGADTISFPPIVGFGTNSGSPHHQNSNRKLKKGGIVLIDMGMKYKGYCSDMTRMIFTKNPTTFEEKIYNTVLMAQEEAAKKIKADVIGQDMDKISRDIIKKAGYGKYFGHSLGHGIGLEVHESPYLSSGYSKPILIDTIVTVEPGIYLKNSFGVRIEDMVLVKHDRAINLTRIPKKLEDSIFKI